jgi:hypothetical protein
MVANYTFKGSLVAVISKKKKSLIIDETLAEE